VQLEARDWANFEQPVVRYVLLGPLYWLGVVGLSADGRHVTRRAALRSRPGATLRPAEASESPEPTMPGAGHTGQSVPGAAVPTAEADRGGKSVPGATVPTAKADRGGKSVPGATVP